jgi:hypothetical protein
LSGQQNAGRQIQRLLRQLIPQKKDPPFMKKSLMIVAFLATGFASTGWAHAD